MQITLTIEIDGNEITLIRPEKGKPKQPQTEHEKEYQKAWRAKNPNYHKEYYRQHKYGTLQQEINGN